MISRLESLPNEILLIIFSNLSWSQLLISLWSLNKHFDILICSVLSKSNNGLIITEPDLSFTKCRSILSPLISDSLSLFVSSIRCVHLDGENSISYNLIDEWIFDYEKEFVRFPNLKSLILSRCLLEESSIETLLFLIKYQLNELSLTFHEDTIDFLKNNLKLIGRSVGRLMTTVQQLICKFFTFECRLISLRLDIACHDTAHDLHHCLKPAHNISAEWIFEEYQPYCFTLRHLYIHLEDTCFLEDVIEHVPRLEKLCVYFRYSLDTSSRSKGEVETLIRTNGNWFNKVPVLECFVLKTRITNDFEFAYLKWILNNLNHIRKLKLRLQSGSLCGRNKTIWNSIVDANFIRDYCISDTTINLSDFDFCVSSQSKLSMNNIDQIIHSFRIHPFFIDHGWTNVQCVYDPIDSYQHLSSSLIHRHQYFNNSVNCNNVLVSSSVRCISISLHPSLYLLLEQFDELFPNVVCIKIYMGSYRVSDDSMSLPSLELPFEIGRRKISDIKFQNIKKLDFDPYRVRDTGREHLIDRVKARTKLVAHLISMPVQLYDLRIPNFEWLLDIFEYASDELRKDLLNTVRHARFSLPSCHCDSNESIHIGEKLVPFLSTYMPHLQTLHLSRPDDFPWTSIRPNFRSERLGVLIPRWYESLKTPESIRQHMKVFEQDLCELIEKMKELVFLDIQGEIHKEKVKPYHAMVICRFQNSRSQVETTRFRLWL